MACDTRCCRFDARRGGSAGSNRLATQARQIRRDVFDLLVAVPAAVIVTGSIMVNFSQIVPMMTFLVVATVAMLAFMLRDMELKRTEAHAMIALYLLFGVWMALEAFGVTHLLAIR